MSVDDVHRKVQDHLFGVEAGMTSQEATEHINGCARCKAFFLVVSCSGNREDADHAAAIALGAEGSLPAGYIQATRHVGRLPCPILIAAGVLIVVLICTADWWFPAVTRLMSGG